MHRFHHLFEIFIVVVVVLFERNSFFSRQFWVLFFFIYLSLASKMPQAAFLEQGGCFSNDDGEDSENVKKANNNFAPASHFFVYISLRSLQD